MRRIRLALGAASLAFPLVVLACVGDDPTPATPAGTDSGGSDASTDTNVDEVSTTSDADAGTFCTSENAIVCEDFDQGDFGLHGWSIDSANDGGPPTIESTPTRSAPSALHSKSAGGAADSWPRIIRTANVSSTTTKWTYEAEILLVSRAAPGASLPILGFTLAATGGVPVVLNLRPTGEADCTAFTSTAASPLSFSLQQWHKVVLSVERVLGTYTVECRIDAQPVVSMSGLSGGGVVTQDRRLTVGLVNYPGNGATEAVYDNVVFRAQ